MVDETGKIIECQQLDNGMELILYDRSRIMAGDRWLVDLLCEAHIPIDDSYWRIVADEDPQYLPDIKEMLGGKLVFTTNKKRNFVDDEEREAGLQEMIAQVYGSILVYLNRPDFPLRLFKKQYRDSRQKVLIHQAMNRPEKSIPDD